MTRHDGTDAEDRLHPAVARARQLRHRAGLPASLVDVTVLSRVHSLFENIGRSGPALRRDDHDVA